MCQPDTVTMCRIDVAFIMSVTYVSTNDDDKV